MTSSHLIKIGGDPYLIACALHLNATIITEEVPKPTITTGHNRKMPDACDEVGVEWADVGGMRKRKGLIDLLNFRVDWDK